MYNMFPIPPSKMCINAFLKNRPSPPSADQTIHTTSDQPTTKKAIHQSPCQYPNSINRNNTPPSLGTRTLNINPINPTFRPPNERTHLIAHMPKHVKCKTVPSSVPKIKIVPFCCSTESLSPEKCTDNGVVLGLFPQFPKDEDNERSDLNSPNPFKGLKRPSMKSSTRLSQYKKDGKTGIHRGSHSKFTEDGVFSSHREGKTDVPMDANQEYYTEPGKLCSEPEEMNDNESIVPQVTLKTPTDDKAKKPVQANIGLKRKKSAIGSTIDSLGNLSVAEEGYNAALNDGRAQNPVTMEFRPAKKREL
ncbi:hypothetical protein BGW36DRAFT_431532 [Talaromyces proteolyticus]|uniref:Uncharacterized protein n=1 Tax=Talaromyces proteolyticus TaxID=1131652 RepID=A0AAD4KHK1_9EURO|nr:uncharacterized protein BGW36DRAFT_431532 [Talaromyces proteolyticus]KAH8692314.1 hypothetical protein BGW36DRAFT_431532 [Talaromyces proteolyticus]